jgi:hypothetical protein
MRANIKTWWFDFKQHHQWSSLLRSNGICLEGGDRILIREKVSPVSKRRNIPYDARSETARAVMTLTAENRTLLRQVIHEENIDCD